MALAIGFPAAIYKLFPDGNNFRALLLSILFIALSSSSLLIIIRMMLKQITKDLQPQTAPPLGAPETDKMLGAQGIPVSSVAEKTTDRLAGPNPVLRD